MTNSEGVHAAVRVATGTTLDYNGDWHALFTLNSITAGTFNERLLRWINFKLSANYNNLPQAMQVYAVSQGFNNWSSMTTIVL